MKKRHLDFKVWEKEVLKNPQVRKEYDKLEPEFTLISAIIEARLKRGVTQKLLAQRMGTKQSVISRLESGTANPSFAFLKRLAVALETRLSVTFT